MEFKISSVKMLIFKRKASKNSIIQLVSKEKTLTDISAEQLGKELKITSNGEVFFLTNSAAISPGEKRTIVQTNRKPTIEALQKGELTFKKWLHVGNLPTSDTSRITASWMGNFSFVEEDTVAKINGLRQPQVGALHMIMGHLKLPLSSGIVVLPTGTGKTETMLATLVANRCTKLLVVVPSVALRVQISEKFISLGLLKEFKIIGEQALYPTVGTIYEAFDNIQDFYTFVRKSNVIVATMSILQQLGAVAIEHLSNACSHVFIDEAHHVEAPSWNEMKARFDERKIIQFTATPFRNDGKRLEGTILFNFPLSEAQRQGYYKTIEFISVSEFGDSADEKIATAAVTRLRQDIAQGYNHILLARCATKDRAKDVFERFYKQHTDLNPVVIYSNAPGAKATYQKIVSRKAGIIVCVDMLGEGFDLPELKVAAFHDIRKSLPITLQFAGRFTRTKLDEKLGNASFIANIADPMVADELEDLYSRDANWSKLLADLAQAKVENEVDFKKIMTGFSKIKDAKIPINNVKIKLSTVVYKADTDNWFPDKFKQGVRDYETAFFQYDDVNHEERLLVIVTAEQEQVEWIESKEIQQLIWRIIVVFWDEANKLLFINSSDNSSLYDDLAKAVVGPSARLINGVDVFKTFHSINRIILQNVGLRNHLGKDIRFRMMVGRDIEAALSLIEKEKSEKAFVMGSGYEAGKMVNLGASYKGRIWTKRENDLSIFKKWCLKIGSKLLDPTIDPNQFLLETLVPSFVTKLPNSEPVWIDWDESLYNESETRFKFNIGSSVSDLSSTDIELVSKQNATTVIFAICNEYERVEFQLELFLNNSGSEPFEDYKITQHSGPNTTVKYGRKNLSGTTFFQNLVPTIWFADGSSLRGNDQVILKQPIGLFDKNRIEGWDWTGVDLSKESQGVQPITNSIQYHVIQYLKNSDVDFIHDDDGSGEAADIITIKVNSGAIKFTLYHLKYAKKGRINNQVTSLYEVCGQAQKSMHWRHKGGKALITHLLRRNQRTKNGTIRDRLEKGSWDDLERLKKLADRTLSSEFEVVIVQPSIPRKSVSDSLLKLLGVTENFINELSGAPLRVIGNMLDK